MRVAAKRRAKTFGDIAGEFAANFGLTPDPWQSLVLEDWLAASAKDEWKHMTCGLSVPRQNGKNALLEIRELFGMVLLGEKILHSAHEVKTAQAHYRRFKQFFGKKANDESADFPERTGSWRTSVTSTARSRSRSRTAQSCESSRDRSRQDVASPLT